jgi:hypothetical protein
MTKPKRYKRSSSEFKREAIMRASDEGMTDKAVCNELSVTGYAQPPKVGYDGRSRIYLPCARSMTAY